MLGPTILRVVGQQCCVRLHGPLAEECKCTVLKIEPLIFHIHLSIVLYEKQTNELYMEEKGKWEANLLERCRLGFQIRVWRVISLSTLLNILSSEQKFFYFSPPPHPLPQQLPFPLALATQANTCIVSYRIVSSAAKTESNDDRYIFGKLHVRYHIETA